MTPDSAASAPPRIQTTLITRSTSIPEADASAGLSETARVALPIRVRSSQNPVSTITMIAMMLLTSARGVIDDRADVDAGLALVLRVGAVRASEQVEVEVPQEDGQADRDDQHRDQAGAALAKPAPEQRVLQTAQDAADEHAQGAGEDERDVHAGR